MHMYTRTKHVSHLVWGKKLPQMVGTGKEHARRAQPPPTALPAPSVARRHRRPHHPAGTPGRKQQQRPLPCPPWPLSPGFVVVTAQAAGQILTGTGRESEERAGEAGAAQSRGRSLAAAPLLRSAGPARAPPGGERRRLSGAGREPGAGTSRGRGPSGAGSPQNRRNREVGRDL